GDLLDRGPEGFDELVRQVAHESDGVGDRELTPVSGTAATHRRVERREEGVLDEDARARQTVEQARLARVRVPRDRHGRDGVAITIGALRLSSGGESLDLLTQLRHARVDPPTIKFDLRFTGTARSHAR